MRLRFQFEAVDSETGVLYFYNQSTGQTQWERPGTKSNPSSTPTLPSDWQEATDMATGYLFTCWHSWVQSCVSVLGLLFNTLYCRANILLQHHDKWIKLGVPSGVYRETKTSYHGWRFNAREMCWMWWLGLWSCPILGLLQSLYKVEIRIYSN